MAKKQGVVVVEGAQLKCSLGALPMVPLTVKHKDDDKYFINNKKIATWLEDKQEHMNFGRCSRNNSFPACTPGIKWSDYYENAEFGKQKILIDESTGMCKYKGKVTVLYHGQTAQPSSRIYKKDKNDSYDIFMLSPQVAATKGKVLPSVSKIELVASPAQTIPDNREVNFEIGGSVKSIMLVATVGKKDDKSLVSWCVYKGDNQKDRIKTYLEYGSILIVNLEDLPEGKTTIFGYGRTPTGDSTKIIIHRRHNQLEKIEGKNSVAKYTPAIYRPKYVFEKTKQAFTHDYASRMKPIWRIIQDNKVLYSSNLALGDSSTDLSGLTVAVLLDGSLSVVYKNSGTYTVVIQDYSLSKNLVVSEEKTLSVKVNNRIIDRVELRSGSSKIRKTESVQLAFSNPRFNYGDLTIGVGDKGFWYMQKGKGAVVYLGLEKTLSISAANMKDKSADISPYGSYIFKVFGEKTDPKQLSLGADAVVVEVARNRAESIEGPVMIPVGASVTYKAKTLMELSPGENVEWMQINPLIKTEKGMLGNEIILTPLMPTQIQLNFYLLGNEVSSKPLYAPLPIVANYMSLVKALWCYANGKKRTETSWEEENYIHISLEGITHTPVKIKVWVQHSDSGKAETLSYDDCLLKEIDTSLNANGSLQVSFIANGEIKEKIQRIYPEENSRAKLFFTLEFTAQQPLDISKAKLVHKGNSEEVPSVQTRGKNQYLVLDPEEDLKIPAEPRIVAINFSNEAADDIQVGVTQYEKKHTIWVNTVGMPKEKLVVIVYKQLLKDDMKETYNDKEKAFAVTAQVKKYEAQEVGTDGLLALDFTPEKKDADADPQLFYIAVYTEEKDENGEIKLVERGSQLASLDRNLPFNKELSRDCSQVGIAMPTLEEGQDPTADQLKDIVSKFFHFYNPLYVSETGTIEDQQVISPVLVERGDSKKTRTCYCDRDFTEEEVRSLVKTIKGKEVIWEGMSEACQIEDKSFKSLTFELNKMFRKYNINKCIQKITFLAQVNAETGFFSLSHEEKSIHLSSKSIYKGRGLIQLTGGLNADKTAYNIPGPYKKYGESLGDESKFINNPELIATNLHYTVDSAGWEWEIEKKVPKWDDGKDDSLKAKEVKKWKREKFSKGLGKSLNELALVMEETGEEENYFWLQSKMLNGYIPAHKDKPDPHGWSKRKEGLQKLKVWFKYDKDVCKGEKELNFVSGSMPPWMEIAWKEFNDYKGKHNGQSPLKERIFEYFDNTVHNTGTNKENWCAAFVTWCLNKGNPSYVAPSGYGTIRARAFAPKGKYKEDHYWEEGKETRENTPCYGAIAMIKWESTGGEHVAFVIGETSSGRIALLGGNQSIRNSNGGKVGSGITKSSAKKSEIKFYMYPLNYIPQESFYNLDSEDITDQLSSSDTHL